MTKKDIKINKNSNNNNEDCELFCGYASIFNVIDSQQDIILANAINIEDVKNSPLLWQHDVEKPIGQITNAYIDNIGLFIYCKIVKDTFYGKEAYNALKNNIVNGLSIGYRINENGYKTDNKVRILNNIKIVEISIVSLPANELTLLKPYKNND